MIGPLLLVWENQELSSRGAVHIKTFSESDLAPIVNNEMLESQPSSSDAVSKTVNNATS